MAEMGRREALVGTGLLLAAGASARAEGRVVRNGRLKQSLCRWCYKDIPLPELCQAAAGMGLSAIDLVDERDWPLLADHGLVCSMGWRTGGDIPNGLNDPANHDLIVNGLLRAFPAAVKAKVPNLIAFFGNRKGRGDEDAIRPGYVRKHLAQGRLHHRPAPNHRLVLVDQRTDRDRFKTPGFHRL